MNIEFLKKILLFIFIIILLKFGIEFLKSEFFKIEKINIKSNIRISNKDILKPILDLKGKHILKINTKLLEQKLKTDVRLNFVKIKADIPDVLNVELREREAYIAVLYKSKLYVADKDAVIFLELKENYKKDLIIANIKTEEELKTIVENLLRIKTKALKARISEIYIKQKLISLVLKDGIVIKAKQGLLSKRYEVANRLYEKLVIENKEKIKYIDIRFQDYIVK